MTASEDESISRALQAKRQSCLQEQTMSEGRREARREARRAESPPDPRDRRRRRLNSSTANNLPHPTELVSSWLEQQDLTRSAVPAQTTPSTNSRTFPTPLCATNSFITSNSIIDQASVRITDMQDQDTTMEDQDAGPSSSAFHPRTLDVDADDLSISAPVDDRSVNSRRNGPLLNMGQIVSKNQSASAPADLQALSAADSDDLSSLTTDSIEEISGVRLWSGYDEVTSTRSVTTGNNATHSSQARLDYGRHFWDVAGQAIEADHSAKNPSYPENPALLLVYQMDRNTPESTLRFLPFIPVSQKRKNKSKNKRFMIQPSHKQRIDASQLTARRAQWVPGEFPVELFELINQYLSRDDIKSMRLVSKEFERGVSGSLFDTVVVPFNTELYEMIEQKVAKRDIKGKRRADDPNNNFVDLDPGSLPWKNALSTLR